MPLRECITNGMKSMHAKFHEFSMHSYADMNLSLFIVSEFYTLEEQDFMRFGCMKDVVLDEGIPIKLNSYFCDLQFLFYEFSKIKNGQVQNRRANCFFPLSLLIGANSAG
jgi:hypothetical protein